MPKACSASSHTAQEGTLAALSVVIYAVLNAFASNLFLEQEQQSWYRKLAWYDIKSDMKS